MASEHRVNPCKRTIFPEPVGPGRRPRIRCERSCLIKQPRSRPGRATPQRIQLKPIREIVLCSSLADGYKHLAGAMPIVTLIIAIAWVKVARAHAPTNPKPDPQIVFRPLASIGANIPARRHPARPNRSEE